MGDFTRAIKRARLFQTATIVIGLSPTAVRGVRVRAGRIVDQTREWLGELDWPRAWTEGLRPLDGALATVVGRLGVRPGSRVLVSVVSMQARADVLCVPARGEAALRAAVLASRESWTDAGERLWSCMLLDAPRPETGKPARSHVMVVSDTSGGAQTVGGWLERASLRCAGLVPARAVSLRGVIDVAHQMNDDEPQALLWLDEHALALAARTRGRLELVRGVDLGYVALADALVRAATAVGADLDRQRAMHLLFGAGIPSRGQILDASMNLTADAVLPMMQTVLQRFLVEAKQTLRFGLPESDALRGSLVLAGPGAAIPGLGEAIASHLEQPVVVRQPAREEALSLCDLGELRVASTQRARARVVPPTEAARRIATRRVGATIAGVALALGVVSGWGAMATWRSIEAQRQRAALRPRLDELASREMSRAKASKLAEDYAALARVVGVQTGERAGWAAFLATLSRETPAGVELSDLSGSIARDAASSQVMLRGTARSASQGEGDPLSAFVDALSRSPLVESARIGSTRVEFDGAGEAKHFIVQVRLKSLPGAALALQGEGGAP